MRITEKHLKGLVDRLNSLTNNPMAPYTVEADKKYNANIGNYHLDGAYGGWALRQMMNTSGGVHDIFNSGFMSKRNLYDMIHAYIKGIELKGNL